MLLENKSKIRAEIIQILWECQCYKNDATPRMNNDSFDPEHNTQNKGIVFTRFDMSPSKDKDAPATQNNPDPVRAKRNSHKEKKPSTIEDKNIIVILGDSMLKHVEGWK